MSANAFSRSIARRSRSDSGVWASSSMPIVAFTNGQSDPNKIWFNGTMSLSAAIEAGDEALAVS